MYSLRRILAVRFSLTMFIALLLIALWAFLGTQRILRAELDRSLAGASHATEAALASGSPLTSAGPSDLPGFIREVNRFVVVRDVRGRALATNTPLASDLPLDDESLALARSGTPSARTDAWGERWVRSRYEMVGAGNHPFDSANGPLIIQTAASLESAAAVNRNMLLLMLGTVLLGSIATMFGAGWLSRAAVSPVVEIQRQAERISPEVAGQRITANADVTELAGLVSVLNRMLERLEQGSLAQRRMIADVGHDLRTPLTVMRGEIEIALRGDRSPQAYRRVLSSTLEEVDHLQSISQALLMLARIETGELGSRRTPTDVSALILDSIEAATPRLQGRVMEFVRKETEPVVVALDGSMIAVALNQLLDNIVQYTPPGAGTRVEISLRANSGEVAVAVADNGPGIANELLPHLFERFYRADDSRTRGGGPGLGLTVAAAIVAAHGGTISAARSRLGGLEVEFTVPTSAPAAREEPSQIALAS